MPWKRNVELVFRSRKFPGIFLSHSGNFTGLSRNRPVKGIWSLSQGCSGTYPGRFPELSLTWKLTLSAQNRPRPSNNSAPLLFLILCVQCEDPRGLLPRRRKSQPPPRWLDDGHGGGKGRAHLRRRGDGERDDDDDDAGRCVQKEGAGRKARWVNLTMNEGGRRRRLLKEGRKEHQERRGAKKNHRSLLSRRRRPRRKKREPSLWAAATRRACWEKKKKKKKRTSSRCGGCSGCWVRCRCSGCCTTSRGRCGWCRRTRCARGGCSPSSWACSIRSSCWCCCRSSTEWRTRSSTRASAAPSARPPASARAWCSRPWPSSPPPTPSRAAKTWSSCLSRRWRPAAPRPSSPRSSASQLWRRSRNCSAKSTRAPTTRTTTEATTTATAAATLRLVFAGAFVIVGRLVRCAVIFWKLWCLKIWGRSIVTDNIAQRCCLIRCTWTIDLVLITEFRAISEDVGLHSVSGFHPLEPSSLRVQNIKRHFGGGLDGDQAAFALSREAFGSAQHTDGSHFVAPNHACAITNWAGLGRAINNAGPSTLARHFHQAKARDIADLCPCTIVLHRLLELFLDGPVVPVLFHVDEVNDDQASQVAQAALAGDLNSSLWIGF